ncbi:MAG: hypothetical protein ACODAJ_02075 [Planctomycetota bacterium]
MLRVRVSWQTVEEVRGIRVERPGGEEPLMEPNGQAMLSETGCETELRMTPAGGGFDLRLTVRNPTDEPQQRPTVMLTGIGLAPKTTHLDARQVGSLHERDASGRPSMWSPRLSYPDDLYAPVLMIHDQRFAVGVSLMYDVLKLKHSVATFWGAEGGRFKGTHRIHVHLDAGKTPHPVPPGAVQTYRLAVRFARPERWLDTLEPYRRYFRDRYGGVRYQADLRPVWGQPLSQGEHMKDNPRGYSPTWRTDIRGWKPTVDWILDHVVAKGYRRIMLWNPQGLYRVGQNFPVEFMTEWSGRMVATSDELGRFEQAGVTLGMWWGRSSQVSGGFNSGKLWLRDIQNPRDVEAGDRELRLAVERGIDEVGLDAFTLIPVWDRRPWLRRIQRKYPSLRFITEAADCDVLHTLAPTFCIWRKQSQPPLLADWLNPGHETWLQLRYQQVTPERFRQVRAWGMVPVTMSRTVEHEATRRAP